MSVDAYVDVDGAVDLDRTFDVSVDSVHAQVKDEVKVHGAVNVNVNAHVKDETRSGRTRAASRTPPSLDPTNRESFTLGWVAMTAKRGP